MAIKRLVIEFTVDDSVEDYEFTGEDLYRYNKSVQTYGESFTKSNFLLLTALSVYVQIPQLATSMFKKMGDHLIEKNYNPPSLNEEIPLIHDLDKYLDLRHWFEGFDENSQKENKNE